MRTVHLTSKAKNDRVNSNYIKFTGNGRLIYYRFCFPTVVCAFCSSKLWSMVVWSGVRTLDLRNLLAVKDFINFKLKNLISPTVN